MYAVQRFPLDLKAFRLHWYLFIKKLVRHTIYSNIVYYIVRTTAFGHAMLCSPVSSYNKKFATRQNAPPSWTHALIYSNSLHAMQCMVVRRCLSAMLLCLLVSMSEIEAFWPPESIRIRLTHVFFWPVCLLSIIDVGIGATAYIGFLRMMQLPRWIVGLFLQPVSKWNLLFPDLR